MKIHNIDSNGDWIFGRGYGNYVEGKDAIGLNIKTKLYSWKNDCYWDLNDGIDWEYYLGSKNTQFLLEYDIRQLILSVDGVVGISEYTGKLDHNNRAYTAYIGVETIYGNIQLQIEK